MYSAIRFRLLTYMLPILILGCKAYKQDIMFKLDDNFSESDLSQAIVEAEKNYVIHVNDFLEIDVFTNKGERVIDPNFELRISQGNQNTQNQKDFQYLVQVDGSTKIPVLGLVKLEGMTIQEAETFLEGLFDEYYKDSFVKVNYTHSSEPL
ncbi:MAG: polysaccharide biosynthesis/export family protein [Bacteroidetes bacterium]|nr:polysaccharide biosynthesis/export family protein [Bacteroidota bacterium]